MVFCPKHVELHIIQNQILIHCGILLNFLCELYYDARIHEHIKNYSWDKPTLCDPVFVGETTSAYWNSETVYTDVWLGLNENAAWQKIIEIVRIYEYLDYYNDNYTGGPSATRSDVNAQRVDEPISENETRRLRSHRFFNNEEVEKSVRDVCECQSPISTGTEIFNWSQFGTNMWMCVGIMLKNYSGINWN